MSYSCTIRKFFNAYLEFNPKYLQREIAMKFRDHLLKGLNISQRKTPNKGGIIDSQYLVLHFTA